MTVELALIISIVSVAFSIYFGLKNSKHTDSKELEERVKNNTIVNLKLDGIASSIQEIKSEIAQIKTDIGSHSNRITAVEASTKSLHKRVDDITNKVDELWKYFNTHNSDDIKE